MPNITVKIDTAVCILAANCVGIEPKLFQIGHEEHVELIHAEGITQGTEYTFEADGAGLGGRGEVEEQEGGQERERAHIQIMIFLALRRNQMP